MAFDPNSFVGNQPVAQEKPSKRREDEFDPDAFLGTDMGQPSVAGLPAQAPTMVPAFATTGPTGVSASGIRQTMQPILDILPRAYQQYMAPGGAVKGALDILGIGTMGVPPVAAIETAKSMMQLPQAISETAALAPGMGALAGSALRGAARVAGPAGLAYDIYQAAPYIAEAGQQLQTGQAGQRMREARQSILNAPTPAPLTDEEISNLLASGDERLINIYGGEAALQARIRRKAAEKVLGTP